MNKHLTWSWSEAGRGMLCVLPGAVACVCANVSVGLILAVCCMPMALLGLQGPQRVRARIAVVGVLMAAMYAAGSLLVSHWVLDVVALFCAAYFSAHLAARSPAGLLAPMLLLPVFAVSIMKTDIHAGLATAVILLAGSLWTTLVNMLLPEFEPNQQAAPARPEFNPHIYGLRLGGAIVTTVLIAHLCSIENPAWGAIATTLVMRPRSEMVRMRGICRVIATFIGIGLSLAFFSLIDGNPFALAIVVLAVGGTTIGIRKSRWYVVPAGMTTLVMLLRGSLQPEIFYDMLGERIILNTIGACAALLFGTITFSRPPKASCVGDTDTG